MENCLQCVYVPAVLFLGGDGAGGEEGRVHGEGAGNQGRQDQDQEGEEGEGERRKKYLRIKYL
jgi:hypothetical protein